jgi:hypothetical protein
MGILENFENAWDIDFQTDYKNLSQKIFSETVCENCQCKTESTPIIETDNMGRDILWNKD